MSQQRIIGVYEKLNVGFLKFLPVIRLHLGQLADSGRRNGGSRGNLHYRGTLPERAERGHYYVLQEKYSRHLGGVVGRRRRPRGGGR